MHTSATRRQARRLNGGRRGRGSSGVAGVAVALPLLLFGSLLIAGFVAFLGALGAYGYFSQGLADPHVLDNLQLNQESVIYDRNGVQLATFGSQQREVVQFDQVPGIVIDATTSIEDKTFWTNSGFDPAGILAAIRDTLSGTQRGASTITQQLVRQRLLDPALVADPNRKVERKIKEIIQSIRLTQTLSKQQIMQDYLNGNFYGNNSYGIAAAASSYFGVSDLTRLTLAQAVILAAIPQSPTEYDLVRNAVVQPDGTLVVPMTSPIVQRRNYYLQLMEQRLPLPITGSQYTSAAFEAAMQEPVVLASQKPPAWKAPQFVWQVRQELADKLCGVGVPTCPVLETGGLKIYTTLDYKVQQVAEKWVQAAAVVPQAKNPTAAAKKLGMPLQPWMQYLEGRNVHNGALAAVDYQTGEVIAYVGSANYYATNASPQFQPQFDVLSDGWRQVGSSFKPFNYVTGINDGTMTAATMFMDVTTDFGGGYTPTDADLLERGPVRLRQALQFSLNIPAVKALDINGVDHVFDMAEKFGLQFQADTPTAGLSLTLGTEVIHPVDLATGYATLADGGRYVGRTTILRIVGPDGQNVISPYVPPAGEQVVDPRAAYIITDILKGNTNPAVNPYWGVFKLTNAQGQLRPATLKTGTNNDTNDLIAAGYTAPPDAAGRQAGEYALAVVAWNGNSDNSPVSTVQSPLASLDVPTYVWQGFLDDVTRTWPIQDFAEPAGITTMSVDAYSGLRPGPFTTRTVPELFIDGTQPTQADNLRQPLQVIPDPTSTKGGYLLWEAGCSTDPAPQTLGFLDFSNVETDHPDWHAADLAWAARAAKGAAVAGGPENTRTTPFYNLVYEPYGKTWGAPFPPTQTCEQQLASPSGFPAFPPGSSFPPGTSPFPTPSTLPMTTMPDVMGQRLQLAERQVRAEGLNPVVSGTGPVVIGQSPPPGTVVPIGAQVLLQT
ncbi:MAG TPA: transglycosylase domain-containing protein [Candidatus Acidoferrales bacterium]|nr:transglycosylase domain-containing protein [Candidatus Acidoferrales bacterium]